MTIEQITAFKTSSGEIYEDYSEALEEEQYTDMINYVEENFSKECGQELLFNLSEIINKLVEFGFVIKVDITAPRN